MSYEPTTWKKGDKVTSTKLNKIEQGILQRLEDGPESFAIWPSTKKREYPYRRINIRNYTVWYVVIDNVMEIRRIQPARRNEELFL